MSHSKISMSLYHVATATHSFSVLSGKAAIPEIFCCDGQLPYRPPLKTEPMTATNLPARQSSQSSEPL